MSFAAMFLLRTTASLQRGGGENLIHDDDAVRRGAVEDLVNPDEIVLEFAAEIVDVFFSLEMREELVEEKELRSRAGDGTAQAREIMQLAEGAGEGRLATLVRTRHDDHALPAAEVKVVANNGSTARG